MTELFPFQKLGAEFLASKKCALLSDEMGLGKSAQAIHAADLVDAKSICVVCPAVARVNWGREFEKFSSRKRKLHAVVSRDGGIPDDADGIIISYDLLVSNLHRINARFDALILDEVHFTKSTEAKRTKAVWGREGLVRRARRIWALSATPAPNDVSELWGLLYSFGATPLSREHFVENFCEIIQTNFGPKVIGNKPQALPELRRMLAGVMLRRRKRDVLTQLPPISFHTFDVEPSEISLSDLTAAEVAKQERAIAESLPPGVEVTFAVLEALAQSVSTLRRYHGLQKVDAAADLIAAELQAGAYKKVVIFCIHTAVIQALEKKFSDFHPVSIYGVTPAAHRQRNIDLFQDPKSNCRVFIGNIQAAGTAITLTAANQVVFVEQDWVPGNNAQAAMRCHRIGQDRPVFVRFLSLGRDTLDGRVADMCARKAKNLLDAGL